MALKLCEDRGRIFIRIEQEPERLVFFAYFHWKPAQYEAVRDEAYEEIMAGEPGAAVYWAYFIVLGYPMLRIQRKILKSMDHPIAVAYHRNDGAFRLYRENEHGYWKQEWRQTEQQG